MSLRRHLKQEVITFQSDSLSQRGEVRNHVLGVEKLTEELKSLNCLMVGSEIQDEYNWRPRANTDSHGAHAKQKVGSRIKI